MIDIEKICELQRQVCEYEYILRTLLEMSIGVVRTNALVTDDEYANEIGNFILNTRCENGRISIIRTYTKEEFKGLDEIIVDRVMEDCGEGEFKSHEYRKRKYMDELMKSISARLLADKYVQFSVTHKEGDVILEAHLNIIKETNQCHE